MHVDLIQPRHNCAAPAHEEKYGHIYMPTSLLSVGARLMHAGVDVSLHDENIASIKNIGDIVGINLLGTPYIPEAIKLQERLGEEKTYVIGGQVANLGVHGLSDEQFHALFGSRAIRGNDERGIENLLDILPLSSPEQTSLVPAYELINDETMRLYLERESSFYLSQGCTKACDFCAAVHTRRDPVTGETVAVKESYRDAEIVATDLEHLVGRAERLGLGTLDLYLSNLDVFQTPTELGKFAGIVKATRERHPGFEIRTRGLSCVDSYLHVSKRFPALLAELKESGFHTVGFGVDGWKNWQVLHKGFNTEENCLAAIQSAHADGFTPETLMVFGHDRKDTEETLRLAYSFTLLMQQMYGAIPRPHVSKAFIPGNERWTQPEYAAAVAQLITDPELFQALDFTALPTPLTHSDAQQRELATEYFLKVCSIPGNTTQWLKPLLPEMSLEERSRTMEFNRGRFDR
jgi:hypothetical protein